jgi:uncharacterized protein
MPALFSTVTLPAQDPARTLAFLTGALGLTVDARYGDLVYLATGSTRLAIYPSESLARYCGVVPDSTASSVLLSLNFPSIAAVDAAVSRAIETGAILTRAPGPFEWGGHGACLRDPEGHLWELVHAPGRAVSP